MNKKLILLMLALPLILMISLFTATSTVSLTVKVPVERIEVIADPIVYLDLDDGDTYELLYTVYPTNAANKAVTFSTAQVGGDPLAELEYDAETQTVVPKTCGKARVILTTVDGGFRANFIVQVDSNSLQSITATVPETVLDIGERVTIETAFTPRNAPNKQLRYEVTEGADVVSVNAQGAITGLGVGKATVKVVSRFNESIFDEVEVEVKSAAAMQFVAKSVTNTMEQTGGSIPLFIEENVEYAYELALVDKEGAPVANAVEYTVDEENKKLDYTFVGEFEGSVVLKLTVTVEGVEPYYDECTITRIRKLQASWVGAESIAVAVGATQFVYFEITPADVEIGHSLTLEHDGGLITVDESALLNGQLAITAIKADPDFAESYTEVVLKLWSASSPDAVVELRLSVSVY